MAQSIRFLIFLFVDLLLLLILYQTYICEEVKGGENEHNSTLLPSIIAVGPGIQNIQLQFSSRYFFILSKMPKLSLIKLNPVTNSKYLCNIWMQVFNQTQFCFCFNRSQIIGLYPYENYDELLSIASFCDDEKKSCDNLEMVKYSLTIVRYNLVGQSQCDDMSMELAIYTNLNDTFPFYRKSFFNRQSMYSELCNCPKINWAEEMRCDSIFNKNLYKRIHLDLKPFQQKKINFSLVLNEAMERFSQYPRTYAFCHYKLIKNQIYKKCHGEYVGFSKFFDEILLSLARKLPIMDTEFLANLGDWPLSDKHHNQPLPIFSWCGSSDTFDIVLPTYELTESILHGQERSLNDIFSIFGRQTIPFTQKENKLFWRGRDSNEARLHLLSHSFKNPKYYDVAITNFFFFRDKMNQYQTKSGKTYVNLLDFFRYRYQINIDGTVAAYRFPMLLSGNSLVIKQSSKYYEFFYDLFKPMEHYLMVDENLNELSKLIENLIEFNMIPEFFLKNASFENNLIGIKKIIWHSRLNVLKYILPSNIYCYYHKVLELYTQLLIPSTESSIPDMDLITDEQYSSSSMIIDNGHKNCDCNTPRKFDTLNTKPNPKKTEL